MSTILAQHSHSAEVTLAWDLDGEDSVTGYYLYYGLESGNYSTKIDVGYESQYTLIDLDDLKSYYFAATAYNEFGESDFCEELIYASYVCEADFDRDGDVDGADLAEFSADFGRTDCHSAGDCAGDMDYDGDVDGADLAEFSADFGRTDCP